MIIKLIYTFLLFFSTIATFASNVTPLENGNNLALKSEKFLLADNSEGSSSVAETAPAVQGQLAADNSEKYLDEKPQQVSKGFWGRQKDNLENEILKLGHGVFGPRGQRVFDYIVQVVFDVPLLIILTVLIIAFIINVIVVIIAVFISNLVKNARFRYTENLKVEYEEVVTNFIFEEIDAEEAISKMEQVKTSLGRKTLVEILFNFQNNLSGEYSERILLLYQRLGLQYESIRKISSVFFHNQVLGIRELANMYPSGAKNIIVRYIRDKNDIVRGEAQIAYIYLDEEASFDFLDTLKRPFSAWVQLNALNFVKLHEKEVPSFDQWLHSPNNDVQNFSIRMINYFQQTENAPELLEMLDHENDRTRLYAYQAINSLGYIGAKDIVKGRFEIENKRNRLEIIKVLSNIGDEDDFPFLDNLLVMGDIEIKLAACRTLYGMGPAGRTHLDELKQNKELDLERFIDHIKDPRN